MPQSWGPSGADKPKPPWLVGELLALWVGGRGYNIFINIMLFQVMVESLECELRSIRKGVRADQLQMLFWLNITAVIFSESESVSHAVMSYSLRPHGL